MAKKMVIFCGSDHPEKAFPPFMLGSGALATDMELMLFFTMSGLNIIKKGGAESISIPNAPKPLTEFISTVKELGGRLVACSAAFPLVGIEESDLIDGVEIGGVVGFVSEAEEADIVLTF
ncbi:MAG: DsrE/DsrF/DrsH-like family protein [Deltaproteobacteria bacterium]|nr:DsrE/DsrF/DrsH-like family protein [Deltaproteobacteria bacterium]